jgi:hypothetical protein
MADRLVSVPAICQTLIEGVRLIQGFRLAELRVGPDQRLADQTNF